MLGSHRNSTACSSSSLGRFGDGAAQQKTKPYHSNPGQGSSRLTKLLVRKNLLGNTTEVMWLHKHLTC